MTKKSTLIIACLLHFWSLAGQTKPEEDLSATFHLEFSAKLGGGMSTPLFNYNRADGNTFRVKLKSGSFSDANLQMAIAEEDKFALVLEAGYGISSNRIDYYAKSVSVSSIVVKQRCAHASAKLS